MKNKFDIIVVGGGHAGIEAATVCARLGLSTALVTNNLDRLGFMSCNPSIGGLAKGHMVKEIDALGGLMGVAADSTCIQFKRLNGGRGPAVRGSRSQCDKDLYSLFMKKSLQKQKHLRIVSAEAKELILEKGLCRGIRTCEDVALYAKAVVICTGTFMRGIMYIGFQKVEGGRVGDRATIGISDQLAAEGFEVSRLKTGTPPRLYRDSIDWSKTHPQAGDEKFVPFSFRSERKLKLPQIECFLTYTNEKTHEIIHNNLDKSPMFTGMIEGLGPRYCPSIEDKITRFADKNQHQTFLEPEGLNSQSIYLQGISTSLPENVQYDFLRTIPGLENVRMIRPGYAVEYDFFEPRQVWPTLETRLIKNLFFAGQINGTSGYEEAAAQGLVAGINAAHKVLEKEPFQLRRDQAYIGVLIDDLVTKGTREPYRMMTSRAEHRLHLREDNTIDRLAEVGFNLGSLSAKDYKLVEKTLAARRELMAKLESKKLAPTEETQRILAQMGTPVLNKPQTLKELLRRVEIDCLKLKAFGLEFEEDELVYEPVEISVKYEGYINREMELIAQTKRLEEWGIPSDIKYDVIKGLSREEVEKLNLVKPRTIGHAQRISGVNPSAIKSLIVHLKAQKIATRGPELGNRW